ncbi:peptidylprolyl isomerase [Tessaracoccus flavus]|uniref:Peptidylprolyl isomerase n=1 Tax=Tessaracoccus flavus TaxID=1610493 RepID=A0A1Q2CEN1_9ACTN|nr:peptidylprolyl isomerase [Tessaracoccus flavus]AQP44530.1 peptidylprolyl isomerase [Tessaracoccus flavus]SDZ10378.1 peptidyl-prolyl cis-trans isomerase B (cyclophilin B) [Tessaracoccus flavus]
MQIRPIILATLASALTLTACGDANQSNRDPVAVGDTVTCEYPEDGAPARPVDPPPTDNVPATGEVAVTLQLTAGDINIQMDRAKAPCTVNSFVSLAEQGYFDDTDCHRLTDMGIFVLQCGDPTATGTGGPGYTIRDEVSSDLTYPAGTVAMAKRQPPNTGGSQFFLVWADTDLPPEYTVFGTMDQAGIDVVGGIAAQGVDGTDGVSPNAEARITSVTLG